MGLLDRMFRERTTRITVEEKKEIFPSRYESISRPALTDVQAQVIGRLIGMAFEPGALIEPHLLWPVSSEDHVETLEDWACREALSGLAIKGYLRRARIPREGIPMGITTGNFEMTQEAIDAYRAWYDRRGHMGDDPNALLP
jgi:hypothetical protein